MKILFRQFFKKTSRVFTIAISILAVSTSFLSDSYAATATDYGVGRTRSCNGKGEPDGLNFDPTSGGKDIEFVMSNPVCLTVALTTYAAVKIGIANMNRVCKTGSAIPRITPSPIQDSWDLTKATVVAGATQNGACAGACGIALSSWTIALGELGIIYGIAEGVYENTELCGAGWVKANPQAYDFSTDGYKLTVETKVGDWARGANGLPTEPLDIKEYREWYYGGEEVEDNPANEKEDACQYPIFSNSEQPDQPVYQKQKYYLRGSLIGNFNCKKYDLRTGDKNPSNPSLPLTADQVAKLQKAYQCCKKRSQEYICISYKNPTAPIEGSQKKFCQAGTLCTIQGVTFSTKTIDNGRLICAETYSLCPYNFAVGGGSEYCDYYQDGIWDDDNKNWKMITQDDVTNGRCSSRSEIRNPDCTYNEKANKCRNYCQYLTHCTPTSSNDYHYLSSLESPYFSNACLNFIGDSQNMTSYNGGFILGSQKHFSAPIAQCVRETLENVFYNRAGHSKCYNVNESPTYGGICPSGQYATDGNFVFKEGNSVKSSSFFSVIQNSMQDVVKIVLTLSIVFYGMNILTGKADIRQKKDILMYLVKIGLVLYFATGDAWQNQFFKGVYGASSQLSQIVFKISTPDAENQRDGCQFGKLAKSDGTEIASVQNYPVGKEYLALWDTLDCKMMRYLGFGPEVSVANIVSLIFAAFFTGAAGIYFALSVMIFGFFFIQAAIRALHIFLSSCISIIIMVFVSPIIIPTALFHKTSNIFKQWTVELMSFCLQPLILFAYIAFFITIMDKTMIGSATFSGNPPAKRVSCEIICKKSDGTIVPYSNGAPPACDNPGEKKINPLNDSVACLININDFGKFPGFELIGISIPVIKNVFEGNVKEKILTILKGALVMFLLAQFMDEIPGITSALMGGVGLPGSTVKASDLFNKTAGAVAAAQARIAGGLKKHGGSGAKSAYEAVKSHTGKEGSKGKSVDRAPGGGGSRGEVDDE